jgi:hypothetical protein
MDPSFLLRGITLELKIPADGVLSNVIHEISAPSTATTFL